MKPILVLNQVCKTYPGVIALDHVDFSLNAGEVRALLGKNGAGKSTLVKILSGAVKSDSGEIIIDDSPVSFNTPSEAFTQGICTVYQEMSLVPGLTVVENITLGRWPQVRFLGIPQIDRYRIRKLAQDALDQLEVDIDLDETVDRLSVAQQQIVEIAKAISFNPRVLVLDEPTSALAASEVEILHRVVRRLADQGKAIIYVTHRLQEIPFVADNVTVIRDGKNVGTITASEATPSRIANLMIGADWKRKDWGTGGKPGKTRLSVRNLCRENILEDVSFDLKEGEVLGIAGLLGSGRTELLRAIFGRDAIDSGEIFVNGELVSNPSPRKMKSLGIGLTPEDRKQQGLILPFSVKDNLTLASMNRASRHGILSRSKEHALSKEMVDSLLIKTANIEVAVGTLSGGNQQKVVVGNWLNTLPEILFLDEPTRGIDIHAKEQMYSLVRDLARRGLAVLFISSEIEEVLDVSDRILVMNQGRITGEVMRDAVDLEKLMEMVMEEVS
jgi:ribose transport system ATP-binding protein